MIYHVMQGLTCMCITSAILQCIKKSQPEHGLPEKNSLVFQLFFFISGFCLCPANAVSTILVLLCAGYIGAMAYTDFYTMQVYSFFCLVISVAGYGYLFINQDWRTCSIAFMFILVVVLGRLVKAYSSGDLEIFCAITPYLAMIASRNNLEVFFFLFVYFWICLLIKAVSLLIRAARDKKLERKGPMAPAMCVAFMILTALENFL